MRAWALTAALVVLGGACRTYETAAGYCERDQDCDGRGCDTQKKRCHLAIDGAEAGSGPDAAADASLPEVKDAPTEEAAFQCHGDGDGDCPSPNAPACETTSGACVACTAAYCAQQAGGATPVCDPTAGKCVECTPATKDRCTGGKPICDAASRTCRACAADTDCAGLTPACDTDADAWHGQCVPCTDSKKHCTGNSAGAACDTKMKKCVECVAATDCLPSKPICDLTKDICHACKEDKDCADAYPGSPGLCVIETGACATNNDVVSPTVCSVTGVAGNERCMLQETINNAVATRKLAVILSPQTYRFDGFTLAGASVKLIIAGRSGARISPIGAASAGVSVTGGASAILQDLEIDSGNAAGVSASQSTLVMRRCFVHDNAGSGITTTASAFDIENTVIASNGAGYAGVLLDATTATPTRFTNNTVISNGTGGVNCVASYNIVGSIVAGNGTFQLSDQCLKPDACTATCSMTIDPARLKTDGYRLTATSPASCLDVLTTAPLLDRKSTHRPQGTASDCGADELMR